MSARLKVSLFSQVRFNERGYNCDSMSSNTKSNDEKASPWPHDKEVQLFYALKGRRPVGINRFFQMMFIQEEFSNLTGQDVPSEEIWKYLDTLYDLDALNENEEEPFATEEKDFTLPDEYHQSQQKETQPPAKAKTRS